MNTIAAPSFSPMLVADGDGPPPTRPGLAIEFKWDGWRCGADVDGKGQLRLFARNRDNPRLPGNDVTAMFPEIGVLPGLVKRPVVFDGELVVLDKEWGCPNRHLLGTRRGKATSRKLREAPVVLYLFDVLAVNGISVMDLPYRRRRELLDGFDLTDWSCPVQVPSNYYTDDGYDGPMILDVARQHHVEGIVVKDPDSTYLPGVRARCWQRWKVNG